MNKETAPEIKAIKIDPEGRYILLASGLSTEDAIDVAEALRIWWNSGEKFFVVNATPDIKLRVERVDDNRAGVA